jgi:hypothetical protein
MAKLKFGMVVTEASGKLGGHVFARNRGGAYARTKVTPVNPQTSFQQNARALLSNYSQAWRGLTQAERDSFNAAVSDFAKTDIFGDLRNPTGKNLFTLLNINLSLAGGSPVSVAPTPQGVESVAITGLAVDEAQAELEVSFSGTTVLSTILVFATDPLSAGVEFAKNRYRLIGTLAGNAASPSNIWSIYSSRFGEPAVGSKVFVRLQTVRLATGQTSVPSQASIIIA